MSTAITIVLTAQWMPGRARGRTRGALKHDDRIDILASAVKNWSNELVIDPDSIINRNKKREHKDMVNTWLGNKRMSVLLGDRYYGQNITSAQENKQTPNILNNYYRR